MTSDKANNAWAEETVMRLRELWDEGHSTTEIGRRLGVSKNAIVGKAHRLDLAARPSPIKRGASSGSQPARQPRAVPKLADMVPLPSCAPTPSQAASPARREPRPARAPRVEPRNLVVSRTQTCCWPIGTPGHRDFRCCDAPALVGKPYCEDHANQAYRPLRRRDEQRDDAA
jgi:GcrA cell cycle regulator